MKNTDHSRSGRQPTSRLGPGRARSAGGYLPGRPETDGPVFPSSDRLYGGTVSSDPPARAPPTAVTRRSALRAAAVAAAGLGPGVTTAPTARARAGTDEGVPPRLPSARTLDRRDREVTLPLFRGRVRGGDDAFFVVTESSSLDEALDRGLNWSPKLRHAAGDRRRLTGHGAVLDAFLAGRLESATPDGPPNTLLGNVPASGAVLDGPVVLLDLDAVDR